MNMNGVFDDLNNNDRQNDAASDLFRHDTSVRESNTYGGVYADKDKLDRLKNAAYKYTREGRPRDIEYRTVCLANYIVENKCTVRDAAKAFGVSNPPYIRTLLRDPAKLTGGSRKKSAPFC